MNRIAAACCLAACLAAPSHAQDAARDDARDDKGVLTRFLQNQLSGDGNRVDITGFEGALSTRATIEHLSISDADGTWLVIDDLVFDWDRSALVVDQKLIVQELTAARVEMLRRPLPAPRLPNAEATPIRIPQLPVSVYVGTFSAPDIALASDVLGQALHLSAAGQAALTDDRVFVDFQSHRIDDGMGDFHLRADYVQSADHLSLQLAAREGSRGVLAQWLGVPDTPALSLDVSGEGALSDFTAQLALASDDQPRLSGTLTSQGPSAERQLRADLVGDLRPLLAPDYRAFFGDDTQLHAQIGRATDRLFLRDLSLRSQAFDLNGSAEISPQGWPLRVDLRGGLMSPQGDKVLLPLPGARTFAQSGQIQAHFDAESSPDWQAQVLLQGLERPEFAASEVELQIGGRIAPEASTRRWSAQGTYAASGLAMEDPGLALAVGPYIIGSFAMGHDQTETGPQVTLDRVTMIGPGLNISGTAQVQNNEEHYRIQADSLVIATDLSRFALISGVDLSGAGQIRSQIGYLPLARAADIRASGVTQNLGVGQAQVDAILAGQGRIELDLTRDQSGTELRILDLHTDQGHILGTGHANRSDLVFDLRATLPDSAVISPELSGAMRIQVQARRAGGGDTHAKLTAQAPQISAQITGLMPSDGTQRATLDGVIDLADLAPYSALTGRALAGTLRAEISGSGQWRSGDFDLAVDAKSRDLSLDMGRFDALLAGETRLRGQLTRADELVTLDPLQIRSPTLQGDVTARLSPLARDARFDLIIPDARVISPALDGPIQLVGTADTAGPGLTGLKVTATAPQARLSIDGTLDDTGAGTFLSDLRIDQLQTYGALFQQPLSGALALRGRGAFDGAGALRIDVDGDGTDLVIQPGVPALSALLAGHSTLSVQGARAADGALTLEALALETPQMQARGEAALGRDLLRGSLVARIADLNDLAPGLSGPGDLRLSAVPDGAGTRIVLDGQGAGSTLMAQAQVAPRAQAYRSEITAQAQLRDLRLIQGITGQTLRGAGRLQAQGTALPRRGRFDLQISGSTQDLAMGRAPIDRMLAGVGSFAARIARNESGALRLEGLELRLPNFRLDGAGRRSPEGLLDSRFTAQIPRTSEIDPRLSGPLQAQGTARIEGARSVLSLSASGAGGAQASAQGSYRAGQFNLGLTGQLPLALANRMLAPQALAGTASFDLRLDGPPRLDALRGTIRTQGARLAIPQRRTSLSDITGSVTVTGPRLDIALSGRETRGGLLHSRGRIDLAARFPADLQITAENLPIWQPGLFETTAQADLRFVGPLEGGAQISGRVTLPRTEITIPEGGGGIGPEMAIRHTGASAAARTSLARAGLSIAGLDLRRGGNTTTGDGAREALEHRLNIRVDAPARIFVRGRGVDAELGGSFTLGGTTGRMLPSGRLELIRGRIQILQQRFELDEGYGMIEGDFTPYVHLSASAERGDYTTFITLEGDLSEPEISFSSSPELPEDEVLARLLFGQNLQQLSPLQAVQLASSISTLAGGRVGTLMQDIRESIGLDDLDITADDQGQPQLRAGKYLRDDLYVDTTLDIDGKAAVNLHLDLNPDLTLRGSTDSTGRAAVGMFFEKDY